MINRPESKKRDSRGAVDCEQPELSVNWMSFVNLDELWQQPFKLGEKWRTTAHQVLERYNLRAHSEDLFIFTSGHM